MKLFKALTLAATVLGVSSLASAHHSFAIYDLTEKVERTGVLKAFAFRNPHIRIELEVETAQGETEIWEIESMNPRRWDTHGFDRDLAEIGETVTIIGWDAKNGSQSMALSAIATERDTTVIVDRIRQRRAYE